jgi:hypothetical protein
MFATTGQAIKYLENNGVTEEEIKSMFWSQGLFGFGTGFTNEISLAQLRTLIGNIMKKEYPQYRPNFETSNSFFTLKQTVELLYKEKEVAQTHAMIKKTLNATPFMRNLCFLMFCVLFLFVCIFIKIAAFFKYINLQ